MIGFRSLRWRLQSYYACILLVALGILTALSIRSISVSEGYNLDSRLRQARHTVLPTFASSQVADPSHWKKFETNRPSSGQGRQRGPMGMGDSLEGVRSGPPEERMGGPPDGERRGPPGARMNGPPDGQRGGPPGRRMSGPPDGQMGGPPGGRMGGPEDGLSGGPPDGPLSPSLATETEGLDELLDHDWFFGFYSYDGDPLCLSRTFPDDIQITVTTQERAGDVLEDTGDYRILMHREPWGGVTIVGYSKSLEAKKLRGRQGGILLVSLSLFVAATVLGWFLIGRSLRPIHAIQEAAGQVGAGELRARIHKDSQKQDEIGELSENLNETFTLLEEMMERQRSFTSEASHELRTPIAVILGYCQIALEKDRSPEQIADAVQACRRAGMRMKNLTNDLLELARLESGELQAESSDCSIRDIAEEALELIDPLAMEKGVDLRDEISDATILANSDRLWQVLVNLLNNAVRHTPAGKSITLRTAIVGEQLEISVIDEGEGIPPSHLPHIFDRFYRVDASRNRKTGGSGLGLAISKTIIKAHGGTIDARSELGRGTTMRIRLPLK